MYYNNKKLALSIFWVVLGAVLLGLSVTGVLDSDVYSGMGGALMAVGGHRGQRRAQPFPAHEELGLGRVYGGPGRGDRFRCRDGHGGAHRSACAGVLRVSAHHRVLGLLSDFEQEVLSTL